MTRCTLGREPAAARPLVRPAIQLLQRSCAACGTSASGNGRCPKCDGPEPESLDRYRSGVSRSVEEVLQSSGDPLDKETQRFMGRRLGHDFSRVRIHSDCRAAEAAQSVNAAAFTVGNDIVLGPEARDGSLRRNILAHELVHVAQQEGAARPPISELTVSSPRDAAESEADRISRDVLSDGPARPRERTTIRLSRRPGAVTASGETTTEGAPAGQAGAGTCPCCVSSISIGNISKIDDATYMGHNFDAVIGLDYSASGPDGSCVLEWWEKTNVPAIPGHQPDTWTDMFALYPQSVTFAPWKNRAKNCGTSTSVTIKDPPSLGKRPGRTVNRKLEFKIKVNSNPPNSSSGCTNADQQVTATQILNMVNGAADWANSSFTTP